jgi:integrase
MHSRQPLRDPGPNPCHGLSRNREQKRRRYLDAAQYARLGQVLRTAQRQQTISPGVLTALNLLLLTGARPAEIAGLQWTEVDLKGAALNMTDSKTGRKTIHLSPETVRLLKRWPRIADEPSVFPGAGRREKGQHLHPHTLTHCWPTIREKAQLGDVRLYDACRHSFASVAVSQVGLSLAAIGEQLGHSQPATTARYAHLQDTAAKQNASAIAGVIATALKRRPRR